MKKFKKSIGAIALTLAIAGTFAVSAFAQDNRPCSTGSGSTGTIGTVTSLGCGGAQQQQCCFLIPSNTEVRRPF